MPAPSRSPRGFRPSLSLLLLLGFFCILWLGGGASRGNVPGQLVVRVAAVGVLIPAILFGPVPSRQGLGPAAALLGAAVALALLQLVPLPPGLWTALPGRAVFVEAVAASGQAQPWRPWAIVPGAAANAAASLLVPVATLFLLAQLREEEQRWLPGILLGLVAAAMLVGLFQFTGMGISNPLVNDTVGQVSSIFANRNHFALFLAFGCLLASAWALVNGALAWRGQVALALVPLFALTILASGSRAGIVLGAIGFGLGLVLARRRIARLLSRYPRWVGFLLVGVAVAAMVAIVLVSVAADRAVSINRIFAVDPGQDMRGRGLPTVWTMVRTYFPAGAGLGGFDPMFRMHEPFALLKFTYFNHAHNDWLEVVLDAGLAGLLMLAAAVLWWGWASIGAWRAGTDTRHVLPKLGSAMLLLVMIASSFDYPARTPMIMAVMIVAAAWLGGYGNARVASTLPTAG